MPTTVATFESYYVYRGDEILTRYRDARTEVPGFLAVLKEAGAEPVPLLAAYAAASGAVTRAASFVEFESGQGSSSVTVDHVVVSIGRAPRSGGIGLDGTKFGVGASREHFTLCRCGASKNKPFCDGSHWEAKFKDAG